MKNKIILAIALLALISGMVYVFADTADMTVTVLGQNPNVDSVTVPNYSPVAGGVRTIDITTQITDTNGVDDITSVSAEFVGANIPVGGASISIDRDDNCTDIDTDTIECNVTYDMQFYDEAVTYIVQITAEDAATGTGAENDTFDYDTLKALDLDAGSIAFGSLGVGSTGTVNGDADMGTTSNATIKNQGNDIINVSMAGTDLSCTEPVDTITVDNAGYRFDSGSYIALTIGGESAEVNLAAGESSTNKIDFQLTIPTGSLPGAYSGTVYVTAE